VGGQQIADVLPQFALQPVAAAIRERRAGMTLDPGGNELLGYAGILMGGERDVLRPTPYRQPVPRVRLEALQG
jgi:hypothetical protein